MALEFEVDQVLAVDGEDYVVRAVTRLVATHFSWQLAELAPAAGGETMLLAEGDGQLYEARLLQAELEPLSSTAEGQGAGSQRQAGLYQSARDRGSRRREE